MGIDAIYISGHARGCAPSARTRRPGALTGPGSDAR
ncbi:hypothetical protein HNR57_000892 [Streptomyces paradoxus]|uniref:Uncharacterized protein n=1 Tax=Streptomyces paradoxus TaxID=66375 RepID=A0A7W9T6L7_9ACTN|nr:hypothetical protein [Streptomyces paradoxus]